MGIKIARVGTVPMVLMQWKTQLRDLSANGYDVIAITSRTDNFAKGSQDLQKLFSDLPAIRCIPVEIFREISILHDLKSVFKLYKVLKREKVAIVHSSSPKAGIITVLAGLLARVPIRIHTYTGQRWATLTGFRRALLKFIDAIIGRLNTICYTDGIEQRDFLIANKIVAPDRIKVLGKGSIAGVDTERFHPNKYNQKSDSIREQLKISKDAFVVIFVGRITKDKGLDELLLAFESIQKKHPNTYLLVAGPVEADDGGMKYRHLIDQNPHILNLGFIKEIEVYFELADLICLPSYREGLSGVVMQGQSMAKPVIGTNIKGIAELIDHGSTGLLVPSKDAESLASAIEFAIQNPEQCKDIGLKSREFILKNFSSDYVNGLLIKEYESLLEKKNIIKNRHLPAMSISKSKRNGDKDITVAVTGANGFVGRVLLPNLYYEGYKILPLVRRSSGVLNERVVDFSKTQDISDNLTGVDVVVHLIARTHVLKEADTDILSEYRETNVNVTRRILEACKRAGVKRFIYISSVKALGDEREDFSYNDHVISNPRDEYGKTKHEAEEIVKNLCKDYGIESVILRPPLIYGPGVKANFFKLIQLVSYAPVLPFGQVQNLRSLIYVENLTDLIVKCVESPLVANEMFLISDGMPLSTYGLTKLISENLGKKTKFLAPPNVVMSVIKKMPAFEGVYNRLYGNLVIDSLRIEKLLSWKPPVSTEEGIRRTVEWYKTSTGSQ